MRKKQGRQRSNLTHIDYICCNISCNRLLTDYELSRQYRSYKYRFCIRCRVNTSSRRRATIAWYCLGCSKIMTDSIGGITGRYYCTIQGRMCIGEKEMRKKQQAKLYKIKKLAKSIVEQGGLQSYKCISKI